MTLTKQEFHELYARALQANSAALGTPDALAPYISERASAQFYALTEEMLRVNAYMNLTAITEPAEILVKHYADCALIAPYIPADARLCDVGTGGGFPSLPIAILRPDVQITAVDSTQKKLDYVASTASLLGLDNLVIRASRAELLGREADFREAFDVVTARAVARMNVLCEWCLPLLRRGGLFLAMKGRDGMNELSEAENAINVLGGITEAAMPYVLSDPFSDGADGGDAMARVLLSVKKRQFTPKQYPRANAQIAKKPL